MLFLNLIQTNTKSTDHYKHEPASLCWTDFFTFYMFWLKSTNFTINFKVNIFKSCFLNILRYVCSITTAFMFCMSVFCKNVIKIKPEFPTDGKCLTEHFIYKATVRTENIKNHSSLNI